VVGVVEDFVCAAVVESAPPGNCPKFQHRRLSDRRAAHRAIARPRSGTLHCRSLVCFVVRNLTYNFSVIDVN
jgi:hypothetical protein